MEPRFGAVLQGVKNSLAQILDFILSLTALPRGMATLEKRGVVGILCTLGDTILPPEVPAIACVACTTESWTIEAVVGTWADTTVDVDAALVDVVTDGGGRSASWTAFWTARERALDSAVTCTCIVPSC